MARRVYSRRLSVQAALGSFKKEVSKMLGIKNHKALISLITFAMLFQLSNCFAMQCSELQYTNSRTGKMLLIFAPDSKYAGTRLYVGEEVGVQIDNGFAAEAKRVYEAPARITAAVGKSAEKLFEIFFLDPNYAVIKFDRGPEYGSTLVTIANKQVECYEGITDAGKFFTLLAREEQLNVKAVTFRVPSAKDIFNQMSL